jgi:peptidoglycan/LPS O-acetylase OafA/YrhL
MAAHRFRPLDGIRGLAVAFVVVHHWVLTEINEPLGFDLNVGNLGIQLFFALSGFLITGILLDFRAERERGEIDFRSVLVRFWQSRTARLLPVVLLTLTAVAIAGERIEHRANLIWHATFTSNILFFLHGDFDSNLAHFWSLAVEQQFYVIWPFIILLAPRRALESFLIALILLGPLSRLALYHAGFVSFAEFNVLPMSNFDSLGAGSLLAVWLRDEGEWIAGRLHALSVLAVAAIGGFIANRFFGKLAWNPEQFFGAILSAWLIATVLRRPGSAIGRVFSWGPLVTLGIISYGVYTYHVFIPRAVGFVLRRLDTPAWLGAGAPLLALSAVATLVIALSSWHFMERPINEARRRWQERAAARAGQHLPDPIPATAQVNRSEAH